MSGDYCDPAASQMRYFAAEAQFKAAEEEFKVVLEKKRPFMLLRPKIFCDGNQWCALYGDDIQSGVCGFGDTPENAARQFDVEWLNAKSPPSA